MIIRGNTVGSTALPADYAQTDSTRADFLKNKPDEAIRQARQTADAALPRTGGEMTGPITMSGNPITGLSEPTAADQAATKGYVDGRKKTAVCLLPQTGWVDNAQTATAAGVTEGNTVIVAPAPDSFSHYRNFGVRCTGQGSGTLTFAYEFTPTADLTVNVLILE